MKPALAVFAAAAAMGLALPSLARDPAPAEAPAQVQPAKVKQLRKCFFARDVRSQTVADSHTIYFNVNNRDTYRIVTHGACLAGLSPSAQPLVESTGAGGQICNALDVDVTAHGGRCIVESLTKLTDDEVAEIPGRMNPQFLTPTFNLKPRLGGPIR
ncbi:MAG: hypothetical protein ACXU8S_15750 [Phenylobacterium sp.]